VPSPGLVGRVERFKRAVLRLIKVREMSKEEFLSNPLGVAMLLFSFSLDSSRVRPIDSLASIGLEGVAGGCSGAGS